MAESRGSIAFFASYRPPVPLDIFRCPVPASSKRDELHLTDGLSYNYNGQPVPPEALKAIIKRLELAPEVATEADIDSGRLTGLVFVSERQHNLQTLQIAMRSTGDGDVNVFSLADIYGAKLFGGARMEDSGCIAGGYEVDGQTADHYLVYASTKEPVQERRSPWNVVYKTNLRTGETERLTPPAYYLLSGEKRDIVDRLTSTEETVVNWKMMKVIAEVNKLDMFVEKYDAGDYHDFRAYGLLHALTWSDCDKNFVQLPRRLLPADMDGHGAITVVCDPNTRLPTTYTISTENGHACINKWDKFMQKEKKLKIGHKMLMVLYFGDHGTYLFVSHVPDVALE